MGFRGKIEVLPSLIDQHYFLKPIQFPKEDIR